MVGNGLQLLISNRIDNRNVGVLSDFKSKILYNSLIVILEYNSGHL